MLAKDTHGSTIRPAPPIVVTEAELDWAVEQLAGLCVTDRVAPPRRCTHTGGESQRREEIVMADEQRPFGMEPEDFDRFAREAGKEIRDMVGRFLGEQTGVGTGWMAAFDSSSRSSSRRAPETTETAGAGVWAIFTVEDGVARVEQVYPTEIDALRANRDNTDPDRRVRFLPYGIAVGALDTN